MIKFLLHSAFFLFVSSAFGQTCDTLYSNERYVERRVEIGSRPCHHLYIDTTYTIVQWNNFDTIYQESRFLKNTCYSLVHSETGRLIQERWEENDTIYFKEYFVSGRVKRRYKTVHHKKPFYYYNHVEEFYENGQLFYQGEYKMGTFTQHTSYYSDGSLMSVSRKFHLYNDPFGEYVEYYPNAQVSMRRVYSEPDTSIQTYQRGEVQSEEFFTESGVPTDENLNEYKKMYIPIYPPLEEDFSDFPLVDVYPHGEFREQVAYENDMNLLKKKITRNLTSDDQLTCTQGVVWFSLYISKTGEIELLKVEIEDLGLREVIKKSILEIGNWTPAVRNGEEVDVFVYTFLVVDL